MFGFVEFLKFKKSFYYWWTWKRIKLDNNLILEQNLFLLHFDLLLFHLHLDLHPTTSTAAGLVSDSVSKLLLCGESTIHCHQVVTLLVSSSSASSIRWLSSSSVMLSSMPSSPCQPSTNQTGGDLFSQTLMGPIPKPRFLYLQYWSFTFQLFTIWP